MRVRRRDFLRLTVVGVGAAAVGCKDRPARTPDAASAQVLSPKAWRTLEAACERILDGARAANVIGFIDAQLATPTIAPITKLVELTAELLDRWAMQQHRRVFPELADADQDAIIADFASGRIPVKSFPQREAFRVLHQLTLEGMFSDPIHGGNAGMVGWRRIGFAEPPLRQPGGSHHHDH